MDQEGEGGNDRLWSTMILCSITSPLFDLHKLIRLVVSPPRTCYRIKEEEEEEYFILHLPSRLLLSRFSQMRNRQGWRTSLFPARSLSSNLPTFIDESTRLFNKERKKERSADLRTAKRDFPSLVVVGSARVLSTAAPTIRSTRWIGGNRGDSWIPLSPWNRIRLFE